jgi:hypothetical protein
MLTRCLMVMVTLGASPVAAFSELEMEDRYCAGMPRQVTYDGNTRADCLDADMAIEVEFTDNWYTAIGQALHYARVEAEKKAGWGRANRLPHIVPAAIMVCRRADSTCDTHVERMIDTLSYHQIAMRLWHCKPNVHLSLAQCDFVDLFEDEEPQ